jgi:hypothetical protein
VTAGQFSPTDDLFIATGGYDGLLRLWDLSLHDTLSGELNNHVKEVDSGHGCPPEGTAEPSCGISTLDWSPDGTKILTGGNNFGLAIFQVNVATSSMNKIVGLSDAHAAPITRAMWSPDGKRIVSSSADGVIKTWELSGSSLEPIDQVQTQGSTVHSVAFNNDGTLIASAHQLMFGELEQRRRMDVVDSSMINIWSASNLSQGALASLPTTNQLDVPPVNRCINWAPAAFGKLEGGHALVVGSETGTISVLLYTDSGATGPRLSLVMQRFAVHDGEGFRRQVFSPSGHVIASASFPNGGSFKLATWAWTDALVSHPAKPARPRHEFQLTGLLVDCVFAGSSH